MSRRIEQIDEELEVMAATGAQDDERVAELLAERAHCEARV